MTGLHVLLARTLLQLTRDWEDFEADDQTPASLLIWSNLLRVVGDEGVLQRDAHRLGRISRRALRSMTGRWAVAEPPTGTRGTQLLRLTDHGLHALGAGRSRFDALDTTWRSRYGGSVVDGLDRALRAFVSELDLELAHYPMPYGPADDSITGGKHVAAIDGPSRIPAHGREWPVVVRGEGDSVSGLPTSALLSQALIAFAIDYEANSPTGWAMTSTAMLGLIPPDGVAIDFLPRTRAWPETLQRLGLIVAEPDPSRARKQRVRLTPAGHQARAADEARLAQTEREWEARQSHPVVRDLRSALDSVVDKFEPSLPDYLLVLFSGGLGFQVVPRPGSV